MYLILDNHDSFVYNLAAYFRELGADVSVVSVDDYRSGMLSELPLSGLVLSPGPGKPEDASSYQAALDEVGQALPVLGVCLGHQVIAHYCGGKVVKGITPVHGKVTYVKHDGANLFEGLPQGFRAIRYHSLTVEKESLPQSLRVCALADDGAVMGVCATQRPWYGVQFHPEAALSEYGHALVRNFLSLCEERTAYAL